MASAAWTSTASRVWGSTSLWWAMMQWMTWLFSRYFLARSAPISTWEPSTSWSMDLPISCSRPARVARATFAPTSAAMMPARCATSMEWFNTF